MYLYSVHPLDIQYPPYSFSLRRVLHRGAVSTIGYDSVPVGLEPGTSRTQSEHTITLLQRRLVFYKIFETEHLQNFFAYALMDIDLHISKYISNICFNKLMLNFMLLINLS